jgi:cytosine/uracil/thiamine/allantoin permease
MNYEQNFNLMLEIYGGAIGSILFGILLAVMFKARKRYKKTMGDDNMKFTEGFDSGKTHMHFPGYREEQRQKNKK